MGREGTVSVLCTPGVETAKAIELRLPDGRVVWAPWSQVTEVHRDEEPPRVVVRAWLAQQEDL